MDELDDRILEILKQDARTPFMQMARDLGVSEGTIRVRIKKLIDKEVIKKFTIVISKNATKAFMEVKAGVNVSSSTVASQIRTLKGVSAVFEISGDYDIIVFLELDNINELNETIDSIRKVENVISTRTSLILKEH
jgi:DNA-binding Lrp family transcriptional regulator